MSSKQVFTKAGPFCATCQQCCRNMPGAMSPENLLSDWQEQVLLMLSSGQWTVDWWEGDVLENGPLHRVYYLRAAMVGHEGQLQHAGWHGVCTFLGEAGCQLDRDAMPTECRALSPMLRQGDDCVQNYGKRQVALDWRPLQKELMQVMTIVRQDADD